MKQLVIAPIRLYQRVISPALPLPDLVLQRIPARWHTPSGMRRLLEGAGFEIVDQRRLWLVGPGVATGAGKQA